MLSASEQYRGRDFSRALWGLASLKFYEAEHLQVWLCALACVYVCVFAQQLVRGGWQRLGVRRWAALFLCREHQGLIWGPTP